MNKKITYPKVYITGYLNNRNGLYFVRKFFGYKGLACFFFAKFLKMQIRFVVGILLLFDNNRLYRISLLIRGIKDGLTNIMGILKEFKK
jgi:hypothetical protein